MRKLVSLGLLALLSSAISFQLLAGEFAECEGENKALYQELGVYGFCNAWHKAETDEEREKFATKFENRAHFPPPWISEVVCPCFGQAELDYSLNYEPASCSQGATMSIAKYVPEIEQLQYIANSTLCAFVNATGDGPEPVPPMRGLSVEQAEACITAVDKLISDDFLGGC